MNKTQELITTDYTIGHAVQTIERLMNNADEKMIKDDRGGEQYIKLRKIRFALSDLLVKAKNTKDLINRIDDDSISGHSINNMLNEVVVTDLEGFIVCRLIKSDYEKGEAINKAIELAMKLDKANNIL